MSSSNYNLNVGLHILILFTFLTILFFLYISKVEKNVINNNLTDMINKYIPKLLDQINNVKEFNMKDDKNIYNYAIKIQNESKNSFPQVTQNNRLLFTAIVIIIIFSLSLILTYIYFKVFKHEEIDLRSIFIENVLIFSFVGIIEFLFFNNIVSQYSPTNASDAFTAILNRIQNRFSNYLQK